MRDEDEKGENEKDRRREQEGWETRTRRIVGEDEKDGTIDDLLAGRREG